MFVRQYANRSSHLKQKKEEKVQRLLPPLPAGQPFHCATEIGGRLHLKRGLRRAHHHLHDSLWWFLLLSSPVRLFFQFVFKVQYISTHPEKPERDGVGSDSGCCYMPYDFGLHQTYMNIRVASHLTLMTVAVYRLIVECARLASARSLTSQ